TASTAGDGRGCRRRRQRPSRRRRRAAAGARRCARRPGRARTCPGRSGPGAASAPRQSTTMVAAMPSELLFLRDAYLREFDARVVAVRDDAVALDRTAFYATGGGQPHDTGTLDGVEVTDVRKDGELVWHALAGAGFDDGATVHGVLDWDRRH